ncbi:ABC transporter substrate-binding protein [Aquisalinus flavus]|uniref:Sugar ABC transporter substrate-binding protein n=1 Tax=Aquisalinus flavus TaxID=1526572 RepID=A0A8J2V158_9PROT|nr:ABC transporter substrate-binding protein [Aquisalinus flavus]MBD0427425.1 ABC transporter substrate-binding protein [Aquisalinus flavus]UNE47228.1 substrate-binding domain-containing protein [Aquisalinus flavus]GGD00900.1 sugar ABC transporter substrate-binding protein [Aquisalinus flavus]
MIKINHIAGLVFASLAVLAAAGGRSLAQSDGSGGVTDDRPTVVFFYAGMEPADPWTQIIVDIAHAAAEDLEIDFELIYSGSSRKEIFDAISARIEQQEKPDYALIVNYRMGAEQALQYLDQHGVKSFLFNADLTEEGETLIGGPREKLPHWIGRLIPDDERAGYDLATYLIAEAQRRKPGKTLRMVGISGSYASTAAVKRVEGLRRAVAESENVDLTQVVTARWTPHIARQKYSLLKNRYGDFDIVWVANDSMAMAVLEEIDPETEEVLVGGMDWTPEALEALDDGRLSASMGGHILDMGFSLAILKRYDEGCDFAIANADASLDSVLSIMTTEKEAFEALVVNRDWRSLDFSQITCEMVQAEDFETISIDMFFGIDNEPRG